MKDFGSVITSMITPFDSQLELDADRITELVKHLVNTGTESILIGDVAGDADTLSFEEKVLMLEHVKNQTKDRIGIIASINFTSEIETFENIKYICDLSLADGLMISFSNESKITQEDVIRFVTRLNDEIKCPIFLNNSDIEKNLEYELETINTLSHLKNVVGIKEGSKNMCVLTKIINATSQDFHLYCADDRLLLPVLAVGGRGVISLASHVLGRKLREIVAFFKRGRVDLSLLIHNNYSSLFEDIQEGHSASLIKKTLRAKGIDVGEVRNLNESIQREHELFTKLVVAESI